MLSMNAFGIDLGTSNIKIYNRADDTILVEKNMIAIENKNTLFAYGDSAFEMYEKAPSNIHISYPLSNGVIADIKNMELLVKYFINDLSRSNVKPADYERTFGYPACTSDTLANQKGYCRYRECYYDNRMFDLEKDVSDEILNKLKTKGIYIK